MRDLRAGIEVALFLVHRMEGRELDARRLRGVSRRQLRRIG